MAKPSRNASCPCGSGKKYKKCCLPTDEEAHCRVADDQRRGIEAIPWQDDGLDDLSNSVIDLIEQKRFDEALAVCGRLQDEWPDVVDGLDRSAMVHEALGNHDQALDYYRRALAFTEREDQRDGFDEAGRDDFRDRIAALENRPR